MNSEHDGSRTVLQRGVDGVRALIQRLRALIQPDGNGRRALPPTTTRKAPAPAPAPAPPPAAAPPPPTFFDEDGDETELPSEFATATMGHLLVDQQRFDEARRVFDAILTRDPQDPEALRGIKRLGASVNTPPDRPSPPRANDLPASPTPSPRALPSEPSGLLDRAPPPSGYGVSEARALPVDPVSIVVFWELTEAALAETTHRAGWGAVRTLCVVSLRMGPAGLERSERYVDDVPTLGDWFVTGLPPGSEHHAAVGLRRGGEFFPLVHAAPVATPRGGPAPTDALVRATVALPASSSKDMDGPRITTLSGPREELERMSPQMPTPVGEVHETPTARPRTDAAWKRAQSGWSAGTLPSSEGQVSLEASSSSR